MRFHSRCIQRQAGIGLKIIQHALRTDARADYHMNVIGPDMHRPQPPRAISANFLNCPQDNFPLIRIQRELRVRHLLFFNFHHDRTRWNKRRAISIRPAINGFGALAMQPFAITGKSNQISQRKCSGGNGTQAIPHATRDSAARVSKRADGTQCPRRRVLLLLLVLQSAVGHKFALCSGGRKSIGVQDVVFHLPAC